MFYIHGGGFHSGSGNLVPKQLLDKDVIVSRFRALSNVGKYAVIGAPERATKMINLLDSVIPMDARAFPSDAVEAAWSWVGEERPAA